jgi:hypothetical protein
MTVLEEIQTRGYWRVVIRPVRFDKGRAPYEDLESVVLRAAVQLRGWDFPHVDNHEPIQRGPDWVGQESSWHHALEVWRIWTSGQFTSVSGMAADWRDHSTIWPPDRTWQSGKELGVMEVLIRFVEVFEFAARLSLSSVGDEQMHIELTTAGILGRSLVVDDPARVHFAFPYSNSSLSEFFQEFDLPRDELVAGTRDVAVSAARELFLRFGWKPSEAQLRGAIDGFLLRS